MGRRTCRPSRGVGLGGCLGAAEPADSDRQTRRRSASRPDIEAPGGEGYRDQHTSGSAGGKSPRLENSLGDGHCTPRPFRISSPRSRHVRSSDDHRCGTTGRRCLQPDRPPAPAAGADDASAQAAVAPPANVVTFIARDYGFEGPAQIPAGPHPCSGWTTRGRSCTTSSSRGSTRAARTIVFSPHSEAGTAARAGCTWSEGRTPATRATPRTRPKTSSRDTTRSSVSSRAPTACPTWPRA